MANLARRGRARAVTRGAVATVAAVALTATAVFALDADRDAGPSVLSPDQSATPSLSPSPSPSPSPSRSRRAPQPTPAGPFRPSASPPFVTGATEVVVYSPYGTDGRPRPGLDVEATFPGKCWRGMLDRPDEFRCSTGKHRLPNGASLFTPCFRSPRVPDEMLCPESPDGGATVRVKPATVEEPNPQDRDRTDGSAWYLELADGQRCRLVPGASTVYRRMRANYQCPRGVLFGEPDRTTSPWTIPASRDFRPRSDADLSVARIVRAWF